MSAFLIAPALCLAAAAVGAAVCCRSGTWSWTAPCVGLAALVLLAWVAVRLPGHGTTAAAALIAAVAASALVVLQRGVALRGALAGLPVAGSVLALCSLPFVANERIGELGASVLDDLALHMGQAEAMARLGAAATVTAPGYPTGPHALVAAVSEATPAGISPAFTGLLLATPMLTAVTALAVLESGRWAVRAACAVLVGIPYLAISYFAEGAFKEPLLALFFLGFVVTVRDARRERALGARRAAALVLTATAGVAAFGVSALIWPAATLALLGAAELLERRRRGPVRWVPRHTRAAGLASAACAAVAGLALLSRDFFDVGPGQFVADRGVGGNYAGQLNPLEVLGVWPGTDFRYALDTPLRIPGLLLAVAAALFGAWWLWTRRAWVLLAGASAAVGVYLVARPVTLAYFSGKTLVVAAPLLTLIALQGLLAGASERRPAIRAAAIAALAGYGALAGWSSMLALRGAHVRPGERGPDLAELRPLVKGERTLYLGRDYYAGWELRGAHAYGFQRYASAAVRLVARRGKRAGDQVPPAVDVDSIDPGRLERFDHLITSRTAYASRPPASFRPVRRTAWHVLWERRGTSGQRTTLPEGEAPGALLRCGPRRPRGRAFVRPAPVVGSVDAWRFPDGARPAEAGAVESGGALRQALRLGPGRWDLSIRYTSDVPLRLEAGPLARELPAYVADRSTFASAGTIAWRGGRLPVTVEVPARAFPGVRRTASAGTLAATRLDDRGRLVPAARACGRYVDWLSPGGSG
jgi:hypothetical protein